MKIREREYSYIYISFWPLIIDEFIEWMDKDKNPNKSEEDQ